MYKNPYIIKNNKAAKFASSARQYNKNLMKSIKCVFNYDIIHYLISVSDHLSRDSVNVFKYMRTKLRLTVMRYIARSAIKTAVIRKLSEHRLYVCSKIITRVL